MTHFDLDDNAFYNWAVKKIAEDVKIEEFEEFCTKYPPNELKHIYTILGQKVIPILHSEGIPIANDQCFKLFRMWFVRMAIATQNSTPERDTDRFNRTSVFVSTRNTGNAHTLDFFQVAFVKYVRAVPPVPEIV